MPYISSFVYIYSHLLSSAFRITANLLASLLCKSCRGEFFFNEEEKDKTDGFFYRIFYSPFFLAHLVVLNFAEYVAFWSVFGFFFFS